MTDYRNYTKYFNNITILNYNNRERYFKILFMNKVQIDLVKEYRKVREQIKDLSKKIDVDKLSAADREEIKAELQSAIDIIKSSMNKE